MQLRLPTVIACALLCFAALWQTLAQPAHAQEPIEIFDAHLHYNWEP